MSQPLKTVLPALVVLALGLGGFAYLSYWEKQQFAAAEQLPAAEVASEPRPGSVARGPGPSATGEVPARNAAEPVPIESAAPSPEPRSPGTAAPTESRRDRPAADQRAEPPRTASKADRPTGAGRDRAPAGSPGTSGTATRQAQARSGDALPPDVEFLIPAPPDSRPPAPIAPEGDSNAPAPDDSGSADDPDSEAEVAGTDPVIADDADSSGGPRDGANSGSNSDPGEGSESEAIVRMALSSSEYFVGDQVAVAVRIEGGTDVAHVPFHVNFDSQVLQFDFGEEGEFLRSDGAGTAFFAKLAGGGSSVFVGLSRLGDVGGVDGSGGLCVLHFSAVGEGSTSISFSSQKVRNSSSGLARAIFHPTVITVK